MQDTRKLVFSVALILAVGTSFAHIELATPFSDCMVLQRDRAVPVWGVADPGERICVSFAGTSVETTADAKGAWRVNLPAMPASKENRTLTAKGVTNEAVVRNVLVGEVWFASGQSNMECPIWGEIPRYRDGKGAIEKLLPVTDMWLPDFKCNDDAAHQKCTGVSNKIIKKNLERLVAAKAKLEVRCLVVPGLTDDMPARYAYLDSIGISRKNVVELEYFDYARSKYKALGMPDTMPKEMGK